MFGTMGQDGEGALGREVRPPRVPSARERGGDRSSPHPTYTLHRDRWAERGVLLAGGRTLPGHAALSRRPSAHASKRAVGSW